MNSITQRLVIGGIVSFFVVWILSQYSRKLAQLYVIMFVVMILVYYRNQIVPSVGIILGTIRGSLA